MDIYKLIACQFVSFIFRIINNTIPYVFHEQEEQEEQVEQEELIFYLIRTAFFAGDETIELSMSL